MTFTESISTCFKKYADFNGCASRSEYWWYSLFIMIMLLVLMLVSGALYALFALGTLVPSLAVTIRRLHDTDRSAWWLLLALIPLIGSIILIVWFVQEGKSSRYCGAASEAVPT